MSHTAGDSAQSVELSSYRQTNLYTSFQWTNLGAQKIRVVEHNFIIYLQSGGDGLNHRFCRVVTAITFRQRAGSKSGATRGVALLPVPTVSLLPSWIW